jgi:glycosyltransferase involved in cell wall biosynthesis
VDGGVWQANSVPHRVAQALEQRMYAAADGLIVLSHRARRVVEELAAVRRRRTPVIVVPSCVDLEQFHRTPGTSGRQGGGLGLIYIGSIGYRYIFDRIARFVAVACRELGDVQFRVLTRTEPTVVENTLRQAGVAEGTWSVNAVPHAAVPGELARQHAGLFFLTQGLSEHGCSPTKIGEYWASGLPVVTTPNVSDTDDIIRRHGVGVIVREHSETEYRRAARELRSLLDDPDLPRRCRSAAEMHYALEPACERQMALYQAVLGQSGWCNGTLKHKEINEPLCS